MARKNNALIQTVLLRSIPWANVRAKALEIVAKYESDPNKHERMEAAIRELADWLDEQITWDKLGLKKPAADALEWIDGRAIYWLLKGTLEFALRELRDKQIVAKVVA